MDQEVQNSKLKKFDRVAYVLSALVLFLVVVTRGETKPDFGMSFTFLPAVYSTLNAITAVVLVFAFIQIKKKNITAHRNLIYVAIASSVLFLLCYVVYHYTTPETKYCGVGPIRYFYFLLLITHIILAGVILPFILMTFNRAYLGLIEKHRKFARYVFPLWLYVAVTGPIIFLLLYPCYNH